MSNSLIVDLDNDDLPGDTAKLKQELTEAVTAPQDKPEAAPEPENSLPDKYRNKSVEDIIKMHQNAESELGRRGNELGQYKTLTDRLLELKRSDDLLKGGADPSEIEEDNLPEISSNDLLDDPTGAVNKVVTAALSKAEQKRIEQQAQQEAAKVQAAFEAKHPDAEALANDPKFVDWVKSSQSRLLLAQSAAAGNLQAGDVLLDEFKSSSTEEEAPKADNNLQKAKAAATVSAGTSQGADAPKGKTYRRIDLIRLKLEDPDAYGDPAFQQEIMRAYAEGRVK